MTREASMSNQTENRLEEHQPKDQLKKGEAFEALHRRDRAFIIPNPWDIGSARLLAAMGFEALATTSAGYSFSQGRRDNTVGRDEMLGHAAQIVAATELPVSADLENGFGDSPEDTAQTIRAAGQAGLVGGSIEDSTSRPNDPIYPIDLAKDRIRAAAEAARSLAYPFMLTARAENHLHGRHDLPDTIARLQAYQEAGADVLYAPGIATLEDISQIVHSVDLPVNYLMFRNDPALGLERLSEVGVKRISTGSSLARAAIGAFVRAATAMRESGDFAWLDETMSHPEINGSF
jgi:2-methylisocitrate lyase-like PEP mutase family enzyme